MATKLFSSCFRWFGKCRVKSLSVNRPHNVLQLKTLPEACSVFCSDSVLKNGSHDRETRSNQRVNHACSYQVLLGLPVAVLLSIYLSTSLAFCGKEDATVSTPENNFILSRTRKAEKRKARTEKARVERCKRRLFPDEDENIALPVLVEAHMQRKNIEPPQKLSEDMVGGDKPVE